MKVPGLFISPDYFSKNMPFRGTKILSKNVPNSHRNAMKHQLFTRKWPSKDPQYAKYTTVFVPRRDLFYGVVFRYNEGTTKLPALLNKISEPECASGRRIHRASNRADSICRLAMYPGSGAPLRIRQTVYPMCPSL